MVTTDEDWGRIYPNIITWLTTQKEGKPGRYNMLSWVRFWRNGHEYQLPVKMEVEGVLSLDEGVRYDDQFHARCIEIIRFGRATGDFSEPIKLNDKHVITVSYEDLKDLDKVKEDNGDTKEKE